METSLLRDINRLDELEKLVIEKKVTKRQLEQQKVFQNASGLLGKFFRKDGDKLQFGNHFEGFKSIDEKELAKLFLKKLTPFQLMTLRESNRSYYVIATKKFVKIKGIFNKTTKEYVLVVDPSIAEYVLKHWSVTISVDVPYNYLNRKYKNVTDDIQETISDQEKDINEESDSDLDEDEVREEKKREEDIAEYRRKLSEEVKKVYPSIDDMISLANGCGGYVMVYPSFVTVSFPVKNDRFVVLKTVRLMWDAKDLSKRDFANAVDSIFCKQVYKVVDYMSGRMIKTSIDVLLKQIVLSDDGIVTEERVKEVEKFIRMCSIIDTKSLKGENEYYEKKLNL